MPTPVEHWVEECAQLTRPKKIYWCDGSEAEYQRMIHEMLETGTLLELNQQEYPGCYLHRSDPTDVARTEHLTYVCTGEREDAGPNNNWMSPADAKTRVGALFAQQRIAAVARADGPDETLIGEMHDEAAVRTEVAE